MSIIYRDPTKSFHVNMKVIGAKEKTFEALLDTGASNTCIPLDDCIDLGLTFSGTNFTRGLFGSLNLSVFECKLEIEGKVFDAKVLGLPNEAIIGSEIVQISSLAILGRDYLSNFKLVLDWKANPPQGTME